MPEELQGVGVRQASHANPSDGTHNASNQFTQYNDRMTFEMRARALLGARDSIQNKENIAPEKPGRRRRRQRRMVSTSRSPLPTDYPLQDITIYMQRRTTWIRSRTTPLNRQFFTVQAKSMREGPLQETETAITNPTLVCEDALQGTDTSNLANQEHGRAFGTILQSQLWKDDFFC